MQTVNLTAHTLLTATETETGIHVAVTHRDALAFEMVYEDHDLTEAVWLAQDDAAGVLAALARAEKALKSRLTRLSKTSDETEIVTRGAKSRDSIARKAEAAGVAYPAVGALIDAATADTRARIEAAAAERQAARLALKDADRAEWDARYGHLSPADLSYHREMGWVPARP